ncbi:MAG: MFS transporter, partial [Firmicutes bacterium]|nr:MFS transporter [Bacillota bacterium]
ILYLIITTFLYRTGGDVYVSYLPLFLIVGGIMLLALFIVMKFVDEPKLAEEQRQYELAHPEDNLMEVTESGEALPGEVKRSLAFLLVSIALWFIGYNGVTTWFSVYASESWNMTLGQANTCLTIATAGAIVTYIPSGTLASKFGRKKTIRLGTVLLSGSFFAAFGYTMISDQFSMILYVLFVLVGIAWALINVNSLPMVVEMCKGSEVGKFTGLYYTFSMSAQIATPIVAGWLLENVGYKTLFPYAAIFVFGSFLTMGFVKHGDTKVDVKKGLEAFGEMDD